MGLISRVRTIRSTDIIIGWVEEVNLREVSRAAMVIIVFISEISLYRIDVLGMSGLYF